MGLEEFAMKLKDKGMRLDGEGPYIIMAGNSLVAVLLREGENYVIVPGTFAAEQALGEYWDNVRQAGEGAGFIVESP
jgi:siroheme synthase